MNQIFPRWAQVAAAMAAGALLMTATVDLLEALSGPRMPLMWWGARATGLVAWLAMWSTTMCGLLVGGRGGGLVEPRLALEGHQQWALAAVVATAAHVLLVVGDHAGRVPAVAAVIPWTSPTLTGPVALGTLALWSLVLLMASTALRRKLPSSAWRAVHGTAFGGLLLSLVHGLRAGTDADFGPVRAMYAATFTVLLAAVAHRLLQAGERAAGSGPEAAAAPVEGQKASVSAARSAIGTATAASSAQ